MLAAGIFACCFGVACCAFCLWQTHLPEFSNRLLQQLVDRRAGAGAEVVENGHVIGRDLVRGPLILRGRCFRFRSTRLVFGTVWLHAFLFWCDNMRLLVRDGCCDATSVCLAHCVHAVSFAKRGFSPSTIHFTPHCNHIVHYLSSLYSSFALFA